MYYADHSKEFSHDAVNRLLENSKITSAIIWEHVKGDITPSAHGCIVFDDSMLDKNHSHSIEMVRRRYGDFPRSQVLLILLELLLLDYGIRRWHEPVAASGARD